MRASVIIPFHRNLGQLAQSLPAARRSLPQAEIIVVADGAVEDAGDLAAASGARLIRIAGPSGPAVARNRGAAQATGEVLLFVDTDVVAAPDALAGMCHLLEAHPAIAAVFGAYDLQPPEQNFLSQYKNLSHACVHEAGNPEALTFWAGLGAIRTAAFHQVGGFDERFTRPSIEDIDLGYRLTAASYRIRLDPTFRGRHLKRWTLWNSISTEIRGRGIPWTQIIHREGALANDLNLRHTLRWSLVLSYVLALALLGLLVTPWAAPVAGAALLALILLNRDYYGWFLQRRGLWFTIRVVPAHILHHWCNGVSFVAGTLLHGASRLGLRLPGALPSTPWVATADDRSLSVNPER